MTKEHYQGLVDSFYQQNKPFHLIEVIDAKDGGKQCQLCGNRHLKHLCRISNDHGEERVIGRDCHSALEELQEQEFMAAMTEIITCEQCGQVQRRGELSKGAYSAGLCKKCWLEQIRKEV